MIKRCCVSALALLLAAAPALADPPPIQAYAALPAIEDPRLSPNGMSLALVAPIHDQQALVTRKVDGSSTVVLPTGETEPVWFHWKNDTRLLASVRFSGLFQNNEEVDFTRLLFVDADGSNGKWAKLNKELPMGTVQIAGRIPNRAPQFQDRLVSLDPDSPDKVLLAVTPESDYAHPDVVGVDVNTGSAHTVIRGSLVTRWIADPAGQIRAAVGIRKQGLGSNETHRFVQARLRQEDDWQTIDEGDANEGHRFNPVGFAKDRPGILYVMIDGQSGHLEAREYDIAAHALGAVVAASPNCDAVAFGHDNDIVGFRVPCVAESDHYIDPDWQHDWMAVKKALHAKMVRVIDRAADGKRDLIVAEVNPSAPHSYWILDRHGERPELNPLADSYPALADGDIVETQRVTYTARDGTQIPAFITRPPGTQPVPYVVLVHGGPSGHDSLDFNWTVQFLVSRGYGVFQPQFRGSSGFGTAFQQAGYQQWGGLMQDDVADGTRWLIKGNMADPARICIAGAGYGGYAALMGAIKEPSLYACIAGYGSITDLSEFVVRMRHFTFQDVNRPRVKNNDQDADDLSPVEHAAEIKAPVLLVHGRKDVHIPVLHTEEMERALKRAGKSVETVYLEEGDSRMSHSADRLAWLSGLEKLLGSTIGKGTVKTAGSVETH